MWIIVQDTKSELTQYLLGQLDEADEEKVELRLLTDPDFSAEFDLVVDEITIRYASGGFEGKEKDRVERYFLRSPDRQNKARVICELLHHSETAHGHAPVASETVASGETVAGGEAVETRHEVSSSVAEDSGFLAALRRLWSRPLVPRLALTMAALVIVAGLFLWTRSGGPSTANFATLTLSASTAERGEPGEQIKSVKPPAGVDELRIQLLLPAQQAQPRTYRVELIPEATSEPTVISQDAQSVVVSLHGLKPDRYALRLFAVRSDGHVERIPGSYLFRVE